MGKKFIYILILIICLVSVKSYAQIDPGGLGVNNAPPGSNLQDQNNEEEDEDISKKPPYPLRRYFKAYAGKDSMSVSRMGIASMIIPGTAQIYNKQYWKLPIVYGAIGGFIGGAVATNVNYQKTGKASSKNLRDALIVGAIASYWGSVVDGVVSYKVTKNPHPGKAAMYSAIIPGLGQAYNGDYWKIPIYYTGFFVSGYLWATNTQQYNRFKEMYINTVADPESNPTTLTTDNMIWYRDNYRRLRDYAILSTALIYVLNIIDANVFAHFNDFDISDDLTFNISPAIIEPVNPQYYFNNQLYSQSYGVSVNFTF